MSEELKENGTEAKKELSQKEWAEKIQLCITEITELFKKHEVMGGFASMQFGNGMVIEYDAPGLSLTNKLGMLELAKINTTLKHNLNVEIGMKHAMQGKQSAIKLFK